MKINRAILTAAGDHHRDIPLQTIVDRDGCRKTVLQVMLDGLIHGGVDEVCIVVQEGCQEDFLSAAGPHASRVKFAVQFEPRGSGHAVWSARDFVRDEPFLVLFCDHLHLWNQDSNCVRRVLELAHTERCTVFVVKSTHESQLRHYGIVGGQLVSGTSHIYKVTEIDEKPSPTYAEQHLAVPGLRYGHYLGFFGIHALMPSAMQELDAQVAQNKVVVLTDVLSVICQHEKCLALEVDAQRIDLGEKYGMLRAQLSLGLSGEDREEILALMLETR